MALVMAPSYSKAVRDQYYMEDNVAKTCRDYVDTFGFAQKNMNAVRKTVCRLMARLRRVTPC